MREEPTTFPLNFPGEGAASSSSILAALLDLLIKIQQIPAPTFMESGRAAFMLERFRSDGLSDIQQDAMGNVYGRLPGRGELPPVVISAHLDTVFSIETDLSVRREGQRIWGPGIGDNSLGLAALSGLVWILTGRFSSTEQPFPAPLPADIWFVANVCEEGLGDLRGMRAVVDRFGGQVTAYLILEGMGLGQIYHRALAVRRFRVSVHAPGGHSWADYGQPSAIHELVGVARRLLELRPAARPRSSLNIGLISGGSSINTIAAQAQLDLDLRSESQIEVEKLSHQLFDLVKASQRPGVQIEIEKIGERPAGEIALDHPLVQSACQVLQELGFSPNLTAGSTDANIPLSRGYPAICVGISTGGRSHSIEEWVHTAPVVTGIVQLQRLLRALIVSR